MPSGVSPSLLLSKEGVNPHQLAEGVHQRPAGVTVVDRGVSLQEVLAAGRIEANAPCGADNPGDGLPGL